MTRFLLSSTILFLFSFLAISSAQSAVTEELIDSICAEGKSIKFKGISPGMTVAELEALSANTPEYAAKNDVGRLKLSKKETVQWGTYNTRQAAVKELVIYKINYWYDLTKDWEWIQNNSLYTYETIMSTNGEPAELTPPNKKNENWVIHYGKDTKSVTIPGGPWMTFVNACKAEAGNQPEVSKNLSDILRMDFTFDKSYAALKALCPNAMGNEYMAFLRYYLQPTVTFKLSQATLSMAANCPASEKWHMIQDYRNRGVMQ